MNATAMVQTSVAKLERRELPLPEIGPEGTPMAAQELNELMSRLRAEARGNG